MKDRSVILVVDDQAQNVALLEARLGIEGYEIITAVNGEEALAKLKLHAVDLVLLDVMMPKLDGFETTRRIRADPELCLLPVVLITALRDTEDRVKGIEAGCDDFLTKPVDKIELLARVRSLLKVKAYHDLQRDYQTELEAEVIRRSQELENAAQLQKELAKQLFQSQKMEAIGRLAAGVATDFNNILQLILGFIDSLLKNTANDDPRFTWLQQIRAATDKATTLIRSLMAFSQRKHQTTSVLNLNKIVEDITPMLRQLVDTTIDLCVELSPNLGDIASDRGQLDQLLLNLSANAREAMPEGGKLTIATSNVDLGGGPFVVLAVSDTGVGMAAETMEHLYEPFFSTKPEGLGSGLGLSTVYGVVKQAGGFVQCSSVEGKGTEFRIHLPRVPE